MRIAALTAMLIAAAASAWGAAGLAPSARRKVTVCMEIGAGEDFGHAKIMAAEMFARIGVTLEWHRPSRCSSGGLRISLSNRTPEAVRPGALAYATPYEGTHIRVFWDRIQAGTSSSMAAALLAHVLVHEITHILQGCSHHSATGMMKASWDSFDFRAMPRMALPFTGEDIELIYRGMAQRVAGGWQPVTHAPGGMEAVVE